ncbi:MAG: hypothetical protein RR342_01460 [Bacilli bacterium]
MKEKELLEFIEKQRTETAVNRKIEMARIDGFYTGADKALDVVRVYMLEQMNPKMEDKALKDIVKK